MTVKQMVKVLRIEPVVIYNFMAKNELPTYKTRSATTTRKPWTPEPDREEFFVVEDHHDWLTGDYSPKSFFNDERIYFKLGLVEAKEPLSRLIQRWKDFGLNEISKAS